MVSKVQIWGQNLINRLKIYSHVSVHRCPVGGQLWIKRLEAWGGHLNSVEGVESLSVNTCSRNEYVFEN
jgi:hypothetical protein